MTNIIVKLCVEGTHYWKDCDIPLVLYLQNEHRHIFYINAKKEVAHNNRDIEIIQFKKYIFDYLAKKYGTPCKFEHRSCEMIAQELCKEFALCYCSVLEDNENGAEVIYEDLER